jgi:hypothetical protein
LDGEPLPPKGARQPTPEEQTVLEKEHLPGEARALGHLPAHPMQAHQWTLAAIRILGRVAAVRRGFRVPGERAISGASGDLI